MPFSNLGKIQPFLVSMSTNAVLVMDFHCHLTTSEVSGYLAGQWDVNGHSKYTSRKSRHHIITISTLKNMKLLKEVVANLCLV